MEDGDGFKEALRSGRRPDFLLCSTAAALLDDRHLWRRVILRHAQRDCVYYQHLTDGGVPKSDLGSFPSFENSKEKPGRWAERELKSADPALAEEIRGRYQAWLGEVRE